MSGWSSYLWVSIISAALMLSMIVIWFSTVIPGMDRWSRRFFRSYFIDFILHILIERIIFSDYALKIYLWIFYIAGFLSLIAILWKLCVTF